MNHRLLPALSILTALAIPPSLFCENRYQQHNLVSDLPGVADHLDPNLVNPWGTTLRLTLPIRFTSCRSSAMNWASRRRSGDDVDFPCREALQRFRVATGSRHARRSKGRLPLWKERT